MSSDSNFSYVSGAATLSTSLTVPTLSGSIASSGSLALLSTTSATLGNVYLNGTSTAAPSCFIDSGHNLNLVFNNEGSGYLKIYNSSFLAGYIQPISTNSLCLNGAGFVHLQVGGADICVVSANGQSLTPHASIFTPSSAGASWNLASATFTDDNTANSGTASESVWLGIQAPTFAASHTSVTHTSAATVYISGPPIAGTNLTITNPWAIQVASGSCLFPKIYGATSASSNLSLLSTTNATLGSVFLNGTTTNTAYVNSSKALVPGGGFVEPPTTKTANYTTVQADTVVSANISGGGTITLGSGLNTGTRQAVVNINSSTCTVTPASGTIGGVSSLSLAQNASMDCVFDGTNWLLV
ncbi:MAG TPA: hypothetical protein VGO93_26365 [Candidatus Xenobia bacterium]